MLKIQTFRNRLGPTQKKIKKNICFEEGYKIPFLESLSESFSNNNASAFKIWIVVEAVSELVQNKCVVETTFKPFVVSPLSVSVNRLGIMRPKGHCIVTWYAMIRPLVKLAEIGTSCGVVGQ